MSLSLIIERGLLCRSETWRQDYSPEPSLKTADHKVADRKLAALKKSSEKIDLSAGKLTLTELSDRYLASPYPDLAGRMVAGKKREQSCSGGLAGQTKPSRRISGVHRYP